MYIDIHSYIDRNEYIKQNLAVEIEALVDSTREKVRQEDKENYHEFLIKYTNIYLSIHGLKQLRYKATTMSCWGLEVTLKGR